MCSSNPRLIDPERGSVTLEVDGPPVLIIEVLSESTYEADVDLVRGKGYSYARAGVPEYMALDGSGHFLPEGIRAWRLVEGVYCPWEPDEDGRWQSAQIEVAIGLEGMLATVYSSFGNGRGSRNPLALAMGSVKRWRYRLPPVHVDPRAHERPMPA
jgi:Putative restriction endonuclease